ncbi:VOC family protein [Aestuariivita sp.]|jgi:catechol 2,3-dioxygenase-like lactoylglutathione lyase family enzyme|uniref:VOC family protein n=1 Tax=Aestuariivita sp. TaxID=1872407 RepID=UPI00216FF36F|nr:VOC family protein [Aestuariivita sp.]MCE8006905.1 VOC family protein [Aestuariivita sp.]
MTASLEHTNYTVADPDATAAWMCDVFGWHIRWSGAALNSGRTVHVGNDTLYLALYTPGMAKKATEDNYTTIGGLNHVAVVTKDIKDLEDKVRQAGFTPHSHADYEPGHRFYFHDTDGIEYEVVAYD